MGCAELPVSTDLQSEIMSNEGRSLYKKGDTSPPVEFSYALLRNKKVQSYLEQLGKKLQINSEEEIDFHVLATPYIKVSLTTEDPKSTLPLGC